MIHNDMFQTHLSEVSPEVKKETKWSAQIVDRIDSILTQKGLTHRELAAKVGCNETQIVRWTRGFPNYTLSTLAKLSVALGEDLIKIVELYSDVSGYQLSPTRKQQYLSDSASSSYGSKQGVELRESKSSRKVR